MDIRVEKLRNWLVFELIWSAGAFFMIVGLLYFDKMAWHPSILIPITLLFLRSVLLQDAAGLNVGSSKTTDAGASDDSTPVDKSSVE